MRGTNAIDGKELSGFEHLKQSIRDILTTPIGSRIMLRNYGSRLFELIDAPINSGTITEIYVATIEALNKWEPRIEIKRVFAQRIQAGQLTLGIEAKYFGTEENIKIQDIHLQALTTENRQLTTLKS